MKGKLQLEINGNIHTLNVEIDEQLFNLISDKQKDPLGLEGASYILKEFMPCVAEVVKDEQS